MKDAENLNLFDAIEMRATLNSVVQILDFREHVLDFD
jgi:hypothetical protein